MRQGQTHSWLAQAAKNLQTIVDTNQERNQFPKRISKDLPRSPLRESVSTPIILKQQVNSI